MFKAALIGFYSLRENDPWQIIEKLAAFGYKALENGEFLLKGDAGENLKKLADYDFSVLSVASGLDGLQNKIDEIAKKAEAIGVDKVVCYWSDAQNGEEALKTAELLDAAGKRLREVGLCLCYHNHDHEFKKRFEGARYFDILMENTSPQNLSLCFDAGWASVGGENAPETVERLGDRIKLLHFKDFYDLENRNSFTALGTGKVDIGGLLLASAKTGAEFITVEQDVLRNLNTDDTVLLSYLHLKESGLVG
ncbi:MAG: sugar phosphate isomerase/epimerase [Oscillospiraceae bacterium]|nr:sugar phosphate isomerase/epimerase [Oscillospiraceae bacterium]